MSLNVLRDWLGDGGKPVSADQAAGRSFACVHGNNGGLCPLNKEPNWWDRVKSAIADTIKSQLAIKHAMNLRVPMEDALQMCGGCGCCIRLKIWAPIEHIKSHTSVEQLNKYPDWCWQKLEMAK